MTGLEALETFKQLNSTYEEWGNYTEEIDAIEKELNALEIIKTKNVNISLLKASSTLEQYNDELVRVYGMWFVKDKQLTPEEFDVLKEVMGNE